MYNHKDTWTTAEVQALVHGMLEQAAGRTAAGKPPAACYAASYYAGYGQDLDGMAEVIDTDIFWFTPAHGGTACVVGSLELVLGERLR